MTTPVIMNNLLLHIRERHSEANDDAKESHRDGMNSYGAGYDRGYADALSELFEHITGDRL